MLPGLAALLVAMGLFVGLMLTTPAGAEEPPSTPTMTPTPTATPTTVAAALGGAPGASGANTPQPVGRAEPSRRQRWADTAVWGWVVVLLVAGVGGSVVVARRRDRASAGGA